MFNLGLEAKLGAAAAILLVLGYVAYRLHHGGYVAGQAERSAYYGRLIQAANDAKDRADAHAAAVDKAAQQATASLEKQHADNDKILADRVNTANQRIAQLLRERAASAATRGGNVSTVPGSATVGARAATGDDRDDRLASRVSGVGGRCEHDADRLAEWQAWYERARATFEMKTQGGS